MSRFKPTVEVPLLVLFFSLELIGSVDTNLIIYRTCYLILGYNESECALLGNSNNSTIENLEKLVEPTVNIIDTVKSVVEQIVGLSICIFAGQWSDRYGRKPVLIVSLVGMALFFFGMSIFSYFPNISPWYFIFASVPMMLTGGFSSFLVVTLSYISDCTTEETRGVRMAVMEAVLGVGILCGNISSSYLFYATNYPTQYAVAGGFTSLGLVYTILYVPESLQKIDTESTMSLKEMWKQSFNLRDLFKVFTKDRISHNRSIIFLIATCLTLYIFAQSTGNKTFLFLRGKFNWNLTQFTWYNSASNISFILGGVIGTLVLHKWLRFTESVAVLIGFISEMNGFLVRGLATQTRDIYFSAMVKLLGGIISPQSRTLVSKLVAADEVAKLFSLITVVESVCRIAASPLYTAIYNATVNTDPAVYNFFTAGLCAVTSILTVIIIILENLSPPNYERKEEEAPILDNNEDVIN